MLSFQFKLKCLGVTLTFLSFVCLNSYAVNCNQTGQTGIPTSQCLALLDLYHSTDGSSWKESCKSNWISEQPVSTWFGVNVVAGQVQQINLYSCDLKGELPSSLKNLTSLSILRLRKNQLNGPIPASYGNLINLHTLDLSDNQLQGPVPASFGNLSQLSVLNLSKNNLDGFIPSSLGSLSKMKLLHLFSNRFSGKIPASFGNLSKLMEFDVSNNLLGGSLLILHFHSNLKITKIDLRKNCFDPLSIGLQNYVQNNPIGAAPGYFKFHDQRPNNECNFANPGPGPFPPLNQRFP